MSTIMGLNYLYLTKAVVNSTGETVYQFDFDIEKVSTALGLKVTQLESNDENYPYYYLIHAEEDTQNGVLIRVKQNKDAVFGYLYTNGSHDTSGFYFSASGISTTQQCVLYYKKDANSVVFGFSKTNEVPRINCAYSVYRKLGEKEEHKGFLINYKGTSNAGSCLLADGTIDTINRGSISIGNGILAMCPMMFTTAQVIFPYAYISRIDAADVNSKYIDMNGKVYIRAVSYSATDNKWLVEFDA